MKAWIVYWDTDSDNPENWNVFYTERAVFTDSTLAGMQVKNCQQKGYITEVREVLLDTIIPVQEPW